jgi:uncharacterized membrane protein
MSAELLDRLDEIERRLEVIEQMVVLSRPVPPAPAPPRVVATAPGPPRPIPTARPLRAKREIDWPAMFGAKALATAGGVVTVLGIVFFFALAVNRGWIGPGARVALGAAASSIVFVAGLELRRRYGRLHAPIAAVGAGLAGGYATLLAASVLYHLVPDWAALVLAAAIAVIGLAVSLAWKEQLLAAIGLVGAIVVPPVLAIDASLTATGTAFAGLMVAAAAVVAVAFRWRALLVAAAVAGTPQALALFADRARPEAGLLLIAAAFCAIYLLSGIAWQLGGRGARVGALASTFICGSAGVALLSAFALFSESDQLYRGIDLLAVSAGYGAVGAWLYVRSGGRNVASIVIALALALGAVGVADVLSGSSLTYVWAAEAAGLAWLAHRLDERRFLVGALAYLALALVHSLVFEAPLTRLFELSHHPAAGVPSVIAVALAASAIALWGGRRELRIGAAAFSAVLVAEACGLAVLDLYVRVWPGRNASAFDHGQVAITGLWALAGVAVVAVGVTRRRDALATAGLIWCGVVLVKAVRFDAAQLAPALHAWSFVEIGAALLVVSILVQTRRPSLWRDPTLAYLVVGMSLVLTLVAASTMLDGRWRGAAYLGVSVLYGVLAAFFLDRGDRAFSTLLWTFAAFVAAAGETQLVGEQWLVAVWSVSAVAFAALVRITAERRFQVAAFFYLLLAFVLTIAAEATPVDLLSASAHPADGVPALTALTLATFAVARLSRSPLAPPRDRLDVELDSVQPRLRSTGMWLGGGLALYGVSLSILQVAEWLGPRDVKTNFQSGHTAVSALWGALGLTLLYIGLRNRSAALRVGGLALFGLSLAKLFLYDLSRLSSITRALSFLAVGAVLLLGGFFYQRLGARPENGKPRPA